jgi:2-polyprenyl-3-methyl-5-hydroxy-6-metoxy-1,4-benzoquinol methylase
MKREDFRIVQDEIHGYRRLDPIPSEDESARFHQSQYYELVRQGKRAPDVTRLTAEDEAAAAERTWLQSGLYADIVDVLLRHGRGKRVLDVGCGTGAFIAFLRDHHAFDVVGIEPSHDAVALAQSQGLQVYADTLEEFVERCQAESLERFDAVTLLHVLEHIPEPVHVIHLVMSLLQPGGVVCVQVPNDFSAIQEAARHHLNKDAWWIAIPDHSNYFDFQSLRSLLEHAGLEIIHAQGDFPMELFLLMGEDYVGNPEIGSQCHQKRVQFEQAMPADLRRRMYQALAQVGIGRSCLIFGKHS